MAYTTIDDDNAEFTDEDVEDGDVEVIFEGNTDEQNVDFEVIGQPPQNIGNGDSEATPDPLIGNDSASLESPRYYTRGSKHFFCSSIDIILH